MKIVHIIFALNTGGSETMLVDIVNEQIKSADVTLIIINKSYNIELVAKIDGNVNKYFINRKEGSKNLLKILNLNFLLFFINADVIHCHNYNILHLFLPIFWKKSILTLHCMGLPIKYLNKYRQLFAISNAVKIDIAKRANIVAEIVYNGVHVDQIQAREKLIIEGSFKIVQIGRLDHLIKGQHIIIEALNILKVMGYKDIMLDLIGSGESEVFLKGLVTNYQLEKQIRFLGQKDRNYIYSHLKNYNLLVQPSFDEGFGLTIIEGMAAKLPVLVSDINGPIEIIQNGVYGYYFKNKDSENLALSLKMMLENYQLDQTIQKVNQAHKYACDNFSVKKTAQHYLEKYQILIGQA